MFLESLSFLKKCEGTVNIKINIFTSDFNSPKSLAQYLSKVASYETLYLSFLKEKDRFSVRSLPLHNYGMCSLCKQLNNNYTRQTPLDINDWYTNQCVSVTDM